MDIIAERKTEEATAKAAEVRLVVCLGNPGADYANTRHNMGFNVAEKLFSGAESVRRTSWQPGNGELYDVQVRDTRPFMVLLPMTYMNASGEAVVRVAEHFGISPCDMLVIHDCLDLPLGRLRIRLEGSSGGQRGLSSIQAALGTTAVPRLRAGIGRPQDNDTGIVDYVLGRWTSGEQLLCELVCVAAARMAVIAVQDGFAAAMRACNGWTLDNNHAE